MPSCQKSSHFSGAWQNTTICYLYSCVLKHPLFLSFQPKGDNLYRESGVVHFPWLCLPTNVGGTECGLNGRSVFEVLWGVDLKKLRCFAVFCGVLRCTPHFQSQKVPPSHPFPKKAQKRSKQIRPSIPVRGKQGVYTPCIIYPPCYMAAPLGKMAATIFPRMGRDPVARTKIKTFYLAEKVIRVSQSWIKFLYHVWKPGPTIERGEWITNVSFLFDVNTFQNLLNMNTIDIWLDLRNSFKYCIVCNTFKFQNGLHQLFTMAT